MGKDAAGRADICDHGGHDVDLALTNRTLEGNGLTVDVGGRDHILVDDEEGTHTSARERLNAARPNATAAEHEDAGAFKASEAFIAEYDTQAVLHGFHRGSLGDCSMRGDLIL